MHLESSVSAIPVFSQSWGGRFNNSFLSFLQKKPVKIFFDFPTSFWRWQPQGGGFCEEGHHSIWTLPEGSISLPSLLLRRQPSLSAREQCWWNPRRRPPSRPRSSRSRSRAPTEFCVSWQRKQNEKNGLQIVLHKSIKARHESWIHLSSSTSESQQCSSSFPCAPSPSRKSDFEWRQFAWKSLFFFRRRLCWFLQRG